MATPINREKLRSGLIRTQQELTILMQDVVSSLVGYAADFPEVKQSCKECSDAVTKAIRAAGVAERDLRIKYKQI